MTPYQHKILANLKVDETSNVPVVAQQVALLLTMLEKRDEVLERIHFMIPIDDYDGHDLKLKIRAILEGKV